MTVGIQGSGKSTWARNFIAQNPDVVYVNPDTIWTSIGDITDRSLSSRVYHISRGQVEEALSNGKNVLVDATNTRRKYRKSYIDLARKYNALRIAYFFKIDRDVAIQRVKNRAANGGMNVPEDVIDQFLLWLKNTPPDHIEFDQIIEVG